MIFIIRYLKLPTLFLFFSLILLSCNNNRDNIQLISDKHNNFYPKGIDKVWAHRVNSIEKALDYSERFFGLETDIFYISAIDKFEVRHDLDDPRGLYLDSLLDIVSHKNNLHFWFDFKNFSDNHADLAANRLEFLFEKHILFDRAFVESQSGQNLIRLQKKQIKTSLWLPNISNKPEEEVIDLMEMTKETLAEGDFIAVSCDYNRLNSYLKYLPLTSFFVWIKDLNSEDDKKTIKKLYKNELYKIMLIVYDSPDFLIED